MLDHRWWTVDSTRKFHNMTIYETKKEDHHLALLPSGELVAFLLVEERTVEASSYGSGTSIEYRHQYRQASDFDVTRLDFVSKYVEQKKDKIHSFGTTSPGRLLRHSKGVGVSLALKSLLDQTQTAL